MKNTKNDKKNTKTLTFFNMVAAKIMNNYEKYKKIQKHTKTLTFLNMIAAKIMKIYSELTCHIYEYF